MYPSPTPPRSSSRAALAPLLVLFLLLPLGGATASAQEPDPPDLPDVPVQIPEGPDAQADSEPSQDTATRRSRRQASGNAATDDGASAADAEEDEEDGENGEEEDGEDDEAKDLPEGTLRVGVKDAPPFAMKNDDGAWVGIAVEMWQDVAKELGYEYRFEERSLDGLLSGLQDDSLDAAVAALSITSQREDVIDFTHPFYETGQGIAVNSSQGSWGLGIRRLFSPELLKFLGILMLLMLVVGFVMYLLERRENEEQFGGPHHHGLGQGFWWSAVTMTTVGYGDKAPKTVLGRLLALVWMFSGVVIISVFTASITSSLTLASLDENPVQGVSDLKNVDVGTVPDTAAAQALAARGIEPKPFETLAEALDALKSDEVNAVVYDAALLRYRVKQRGEDLRVLPVTFNRQSYGIGLPEGSPLREALNRRMPDEISTERYRKRLQDYLGDREN